MITAEKLAYALVADLASVRLSEVVPGLRYTISGFGAMCSICIDESAYGCLIQLTGAYVPLNFASDLRSLYAPRLLIDTSVFDRESWPEGLSSYDVLACGFTFISPKGVANSIGLLDKLPPLEKVRNPPTDILNDGFTCPFQEMESVLSAPNESSKIRSLRILVSRYAKSLDRAVRQCGYKPFVSFLEYQIRSSANPQMIDFSLIPSL